MAQGAPRKPSAPGPKTNHKATTRKQTGTRVIKPKKPSLQKAQAARKKHTAGLTALTERSLAGRAGHLEMLGGGKKEGRKGKEGEKKGAGGKG